MNTANIKKYAPKARNEFMAAVSKRLNQFGIYEDNGQCRVSEATVNGDIMQIDGNSFDANLAKSRQKLVEQAQKQGFTQFVEHTAYTWFNRFCAIRFMELHDYLEHGLRVLSHPDKDNSFEILDHAQDVAQDLGLNRDNIIELKLAGNKDEQLYRELLIGQCHKLHQAMPFLFDALDDETELLLPDNLTRTDSILRGLVNDIPEDDWQQVEIIGWLYQFYISEKKDQVIGKVVKSEDIPAATQLFTPNWIVKYLVQNSVGRQWLQTYPDSTIKSQMEYYIEPAEQTESVGVALAAQTPDSIDPETIKVLDPACGSGHILVEAYQVLKSIYEERGYRGRDIPKLILENNLYGLDIDDRAAQLAGFTLMMLARADDRRIFTREVQLNIMAMSESTNIDLEPLLFAMGDDQQAAELKTTLKELTTLFEQAKTFGSLITVPANIADTLPNLKTTIEQIAGSGDLFAESSALALLPIIQQAGILANKYDAVVANPPYMGGKGMNAELKKFAKDNYPNSKSDLFAIFMEHGFSFLKDNGFNAQVNMQSWMFLSSYEKLRKWLLETKTFVTMAHLGARAFSQISGEVVQTTAWVLSKNHVEHYQPVFFRLIEGKEAEKQQALLKQENRFESTQQDDFKKIPGSPIAYWVSELEKRLFYFKPLEDEVTFKEGLTTANNDLFLRLWHEIKVNEITFNISSSNTDIVWAPYNKGGSYRKWYGNNNFVIDWRVDGCKIKNYPGSSFRNAGYHFKRGATFSALSSGGFSVRYSGVGFSFDSKGTMLFSERYLEEAIIFLNSKISDRLLKLVAPTLDYRFGTIQKLPFLNVGKDTFNDLTKISKDDWNTYETSWDFQFNPLISNPVKILTECYNHWQSQNRQTITEMQRLEQENNRLFIDTYGLQEELTPDVPLEQITLTVNPKYRYGSKLSNEELENRFQSDTLAELISYAIGCMMGRYSLDREGLVYAHAGNEGFAELEQEGAYNTFPADDDGIVPLTDQEWFADDATHRFREFVSKVWGEDNLQQNLDFVAQSLCLHVIKAKNNEVSLDTIRRYLSTQFYKDHLKTYKKRPIYWLFSSGKQKAFECLVYLHRYNAGTLARMRTEYVTPLLGKYQANADILKQQSDQASTTAEKNSLNKSLTILEKKQTELQEFDDKLKHHADMQISLDLDDGVKVNYGKFGDLLVDVKGVTGKK